MESANLPHHHQNQLQDLFVGSSSLDTPSCYGVASSHAWPPNSTALNAAADFNLNGDGAIICWRDPRQRSNMLMSSINSNMVQDLGCHWMNASGTFNTNSVHENDSQLARIKEELTDSYIKFTDMLNSTSSSIEDFNSHPTTTYLKNEQRNIDDLSEKLFLRSTLSPGLQLPAEAFYSHAQSCSSNSASASVVTPSRGIFSQIFPTINISNLNQPSSMISGSLEMNLQSFDPLVPTRLSGNLGHLSQDQLGLLRDSLPHRLDHRQKSNHRQSNSSNKKISPFSDGVPEAKRPGTLLEAKAPQAAQKKSRLESRVACQPFKVRKEKLGDRIAALQQLVAPFGKTDTASVLMEAIGYIKFLQNQVETLSVPYMKSTRKKTNRTLQGGTVVLDDGNEEPKRDLKSRGLCLVPLSCLSYVTDSGGAFWQPPNFGGGP